IDRGREAGTRVPRGPARPRRPHGPPPSPPLRALGRAATACRHRPRARLAADGGVRRRADRKPRLEDRRRDPRAVAQLRRGSRPDDGHGHARRSGSDDRRPRDVPGGRSDRRGAAAQPGARDPRGDGPRQRMIKVALAGLLGRKLRTALTAFAIVLGGALVSGTLVLTGSIDNAFNFIFTSVRQGSDAVITGKAAVDVTDGQGSFAPSVQDSLLTKVRGLDSVALAEGGVKVTATLIDRKGKAIVFGGAPNLGFSISNGSSPFNPLALVSGAWPGAGQIVIDRNTAKRKHFAVGDEIGVQAEGPAQRLRISGIVRFGSASALGGATLAGFDTATAQRLFDKPHKLDEIAIARKSGVSEDKLLSEVRNILPPTAQVRSGTAQAKEDQKQTDS